MDIQGWDWIVVVGEFFFRREFLFCSDGAISVYHIFMWWTCKVAWSDIAVSDSEIQVLAHYFPSEFVQFFHLINGNI